MEDNGKHNYDKDMTLASKVVMSITKANNKIYEPELYNEIINNSIYSWH